MMNARRRSLGMMTMVVSVTVSLGAAWADSVLFTISSNHPNVVDVEFYSQSYDRVWPGNGNVWTIKDYEPHSFDLECETGEQICYGAWLRGDTDTYWGVGLNNFDGCERCCAVCGAGDATPMTLGN